MEQNFISSILKNFNLFVYVFDNTRHKFQETMEERKKNETTALNDDIILFMRTSSLAYYEIKY